MPARSKSAKRKHRPCCLRRASAVLISVQVETLLLPPKSEGEVHWWRNVIPICLSGHLEMWRDIFKEQSDRDVFVVYGKLPFLSPNFLCRPWTLGLGDICKGIGHWATLSVRVGGNRISVLLSLHSNYWEVLFCELVDEHNKLQHLCDTTTERFLWRTMQC